MEGDFKTCLYLWKKSWLRPCLRHFFFLPFSLATIRQQLSGRRMTEKNRKPLTFDNWPFFNGISLFNTKKLVEN